MEALDELAVEERDAAAARHRLRMRGDDAAGPDEFRRLRREDAVRGVDRLRMDQALAVEAERAALAARRLEPGIVVEIGVDAVQRAESIGPRGEEAERQRG